MAAAARVQIVVVTYDPGRFLETFLSSLPGACSSPYEVCIADNGSTDGAPQEATRRYGAKLIETGQNLGYGRAANLAASASQTPFILVCNPDLTLHAGAVDGLLLAAERWPEGGAFGPAVYEPDGTLYPSARALPRLSHGIGHAALSLTWPSNPFSRAYRMEGLKIRERPVGWLSGACLLLRRSAFDQVGGFNPAYFMYFEDVDLCDRLGRDGWRSIYVPDTQVTHEGGTATGRESDAMLRAHHDSAYRYLAPRYHWSLRWLLRAGLRARYLLVRGQHKAPR